MVSVPSAVVGGTGVAVDSDDLSAGSGACMEGVGSSVAGVGDGLGVLSDGKRERCAGERHKLMRRRFFDPLADAFDACVGVDMVEGMPDDGMADGNGWRGRCWTGMPAAHAKLRP